MPLLNVVGIMSTYATFNDGFAFLHVENEETYVWALQQFLEVVIPKVLCMDRELALMNGIARVFPGCHNILYCWHINKNVLANCKTRFSDVEWQEFMQRWNLVVSNTSVELFDGALGAFKETYAASHPAAWNYVNNCRNTTLAKCGGEAQHLEKVKSWSPPGLPSVQSSTSRTKTPCIGVFLVSLERS
jgi:hypothetical protein